MLPLIAIFLLLCGALLEIAGLGFAGLDLLVAGCFVAALALGAASALRARLSLMSVVACGLAALGLGLHLAIHLGLLS
jgi:hypothetical protein